MTYHSARIGDAFFGFGCTFRCSFIPFRLSDSFSTACAIVFFFIRVDEIERNLHSPKMQTSQPKYREIESNFYLYGKWTIWQIFGMNWIRFGKIAKEYPHKNCGGQIKALVREYRAFSFPVNWERHVRIKRGRENEKDWHQNGKENESNDKYGSLENVVRIATCSFLCSPSFFSLSFSHLSHGHATFLSFRKMRVHLERM